MVLRYAVRESQQPPQCGDARAEDELVPRLVPVAISEAACISAAAMSLVGCSAAAGCLWGFLLSLYPFGLDQTRARVRGCARPKRQRCPALV